MPSCPYSERAVPVLKPMVVMRRATAAFEDADCLLPILRLLQRPVLPTPVDSVPEETYADTLLAVRALGKMASRRGQVTHATISRVTALSTTFCRDSVLVLGTFRSGTADVSDIRHRCLSCSSYHSHWSFSFVHMMPSYQLGITCCVCIVCHDSQVSRRHAQCNHSIVQMPLYRSVLLASHSSRRVTIVSFDNSSFRP